MLAQVAIDNAKRKFDIDLSQEIRRIKKDIDVEENKYPIFWSLIRPDFNKKRINKKLKCPMNYLFSVKINKFKDENSTLPMSYFFNKFELERDRRTCKKVEELIEKYSLDLFNYNIDDENVLNKNDDYLLLRSDFDDMISDIQQIYISKNYIGLMSWLIDRAFKIIPQTKGKVCKMNSTIEQNKSILLQTLYNINKNNLLQCFNKKNCSK